MGISYSAGTSIKALLNVLNSNDQTRVLSTPSLRVLDRQSAKIDVGQEVPFITSQQVNDEGRTINTIQRKNVGLSLDVLPIIDSQSIQLTVRVTAGSISTDTVASDIVTNNRTMNTTISTKDGDMVYLGGLITDEQTINKMGIPVLQDIPILGHAFKDSKTKNNQRKLSIFIKTTLIST
jgi:general secretion pathway protein D